MSWLSLVTKYNAKPKPVKEVNQNKDLSTLEGSINAEKVKPKIDLLD